MKVGEDNWCSHCRKWQTFDSNGKCIKCGMHIDIVPMAHSWFEQYGVDLKELQNESADF